MKNLLILLLYCYMPIVLAEEIGTSSSTVIISPLSWQYKEVLNQDRQFHFIRASIQQSDLMLTLDYHPQKKCRLSRASIILPTKNPQIEMLPLSIFGKMQIDEGMVETIEIEAISTAGAKFIQLVILRPDLDQLLFNAKNVTFHLKDYGFMSFSLHHYKETIQQAIPACEQHMTASE